MNRREFIRTGAAGLGAAALGFAGQAGGSKPLRVGLIGCGWYGKCDLFRLIQVSPVEVVSLCDVDRRMLAEAADLMAVRQASHKKPRTFSDYRPMLAEKDLDIVLVGTPDHWHALAMIAAVKAGAHVYYHKRDESNPPDTAPPAYLDYNMWTGPAPMRPYNSIVHPRGWRAFMEYGNGILGDMC